jgi:hypothetical protein
MKKIQQGEENKKEEIVMTTLKRRATNGSIKHTISNSEVNQDKNKSHIDTWRCRKKATKNYKGW